MAAGWLYFAPQLPTSLNEAQGLLRDIYRVADASDPVAVGVGVSFAAYILGILSIGLLQRPLRVLGHVIAAGVSVILFVPLFLLYLLFFWTKVWERIQDYVDRLMDSAVDRWSTSPVDRARQFVTRRISSKVLGDGQYRDVVVDHLTEPDIPLLLKKGGPAMSRYKRFLRDSEPKPGGSLVGLQEELKMDLKEGNRDLVEPLIGVVIDVERHAEEVLDELKLVPERIVGEKPETYERWDRLRAEGEFREAIVPPIIAIIVALAAHRTVTWPYALFLLAIPVTIYMQGRSKDRTAQAQLMQVLEADVVTAASIQRLATTDLHWRRSTIAAPAMARANIRNQEAGR